MLEFLERYRLQCDRFEAMWLMVKELSGRLNSHFNRGKNDSFALYFAGQLPLQEYFDLIDAHFEVGVISIYNQGFKILSKKERKMHVFFSLLRKFFSTTYIFVTGISDNIN